jgi:hypothetical protein
MPINQELWSVPFVLLGDIPPTLRPTARRTASHVYQAGRRALGRRSAGASALQEVGWRMPPQLTASTATRVSLQRIMGRHPVTTAQWGGMLRVSPQPCVSPALPDGSRHRNLQSPVLPVPQAELRLPLERTRLPPVYCVMSATGLTKVLKVAHIALLDNAWKVPTQRSVSTVCLDR